MENRAAKMKLPEHNNTQLDFIALFSNTLTQYQALFPSVFATAFLGIFSAGLISSINSEGEASVLSGELIFLAAIIPATISEAAVIALVSIIRKGASSSISNAYFFVFLLAPRLLIPSILLAIFVRVFQVATIEIPFLIFLVLPMLLFIVARTALYVPVVLLENPRTPTSVISLVNPIFRSNALVKGKTLKTLGYLAPSLLVAGILPLLISGAVESAGINQVGILLAVSISSALIQPYVFILSLLIYEKYAAAETESTELDLSEI
tara:strand:+ start:4628 stop:5422 length:795 start_codon:yes stop_codon:yes gene_type:complete